MPRKKPIAKGLEKLFNDIKPEDTAAPEPAEDPNVKKDRDQHGTVDGDSRAPNRVESVSRTVPRSRVMSLAFQAGNNNWSTLQVVDDSAPRSWTEDEQLLVRQVADQLSLALENARLFEETQLRAEELSVLNEMGRELSTKLEVDALVEVIHRYASRLVDSSNFLIALRNEKTEENTYPLILEEGRRIQPYPSRADNRVLAEYIAQNRTAVFAPTDVQGHMKSLGLDLMTLNRKEKPSQCWVGVPMMIGERVLGLISVQSLERANAFDEHDRDILTTIASQAAIAIENARLFQEAEAHARELAVLNELAQSLSSVLHMDQIVGAIYGGIERLLGARNFFVAFYDSKSNEIVFPRSISESELDRMITRLPIGEGITSYIIQTRKSVLITDGTEHWIKEKNLKNAGSPAKSFLGVPLIHGTEILGAMAVQSYEEYDAYDQHDLQLFTTFASQVAIAIENARLFNEVTTSQSQLSEALQIARLGYFEINLSDRTIRLTDELYALLATSAAREGGYQRPLEAVVKRFIVEDDISAFSAAIEHTILAAQGALQTEVETRFRTGDGRQIWVRSILKLERDVLGNPAKVIGSSQNITDRKINELTQIAITRISDAALMASEIEDLIRRVHDAVGMLIPAKSFFVALYNGDTDQVQFPYFINETGRPMPPSEVGNSLIAHVIRTGQALRTTPESYLELESSGKITDPVGLEADWLGVPLHSESAIRGVMAVLSYNSSVRLTARHEELLAILGAQVTAAIERLQAREALQRRNTYLAASSEIGRLVTSTLDLNTIFTRTVNLVGERFGFYFAGIYTIEESRFNVVLREATGAAGEKMKAQTFMVPVGSQTLVGKVAESGEAWLLDDVRGQPLFQANPLLLDTQSEAALPLRIGSRIVGVIDIQSTQTHAFTQDDMSVLQSLADQVAVAIDNARSYELSQQAIRELREVDQMKSQFLANMSHELRTPLNSIIGFSRVILKGIDGPVTEMQQQDLTAIYNSGQHLLGLINDVLDLARIEAGKMELNFEEVRLPEMVASVMSTAKGLVKEKPIQLLQSIPANMPTVRGDTMRVRQVLLNLLSNASKFTDEGSITVEASVQQGPNGGMEALISVIDTGPGISLEDQKKLFQAFSQVDGSATRKSGGSGLGLSICANLVQLQGGRIGIHSEEGKGSTFFFTVPLYHQPVEEIPDGKKVILAIDDNPQVIGLYERYLNPQGYHVVPLTDPLRARDRIIELKPYAITLDVMMPNKDGWAVLTDLKSDPATRDYPVVICSIMEQADKGFSLGAADYLVKPILEEDLVHALDRLNRDGTINEVLVIDDDTNDLRLIEKILLEDGRYRPILAKGGRAGWEVINTRPPQAIILDVFMPEMDGFAILEKLLESPELRDIPVLVVSGGGLTREQQQQLTEFGQRLISKSSLSEGELIETIESALRRMGS